MTYQLQFTEEAKLDVQEAWLWYEEQKANLGEEFILSLEASINQIERNPLQYQTHYNIFRIAILRRFPYKVVFIAEEQVIIVIGVIHNQRDPSVWMARA